MDKHASTRTHRRGPQTAGQTPLLLAPDGRSRKAAPPPQNHPAVLPYVFLGVLILFQGCAILAALVYLHLAGAPPSAPVAGVSSGGPTPAATPTVWPTPVEPSPPPQTVVAGLQPTSGPRPPTATPVPDPAPAAPVLKFRGVEITQGIQVFNEPEHPRCNPNPAHPDYIFCNNSMPLVAGRHTLVRVYPACNTACPATNSVIRLRLLKDGQEQAVLTRPLPPGVLARLNRLSMPDLRLDLQNSINFAFFPPPDWMAGPITFELEAVPAGTEQTAPATVQLTQTFAARKPLRVAYLPVEFKGHTPPEPAGMDYWLLRMYPVPGVEYYRLPVPAVSVEEEMSKSKVLTKLLFTYWLYAQYQPPANWPDQLFGWLPQELYNGGVSDPFWCPNCAGPHSSRVAFGGLRPEQDIGGPRILAHEIAHNLGAQHAWSPTQREDPFCFKAEGADIRVDPDWPYPQTPHIQEVGIDLYSTPPVVYPPAVYDMMAYCARPWISPHTYRKLFDSPFLQPEAGIAALPPAGFQPQVEATGSDTLLVSGVVYPDGTVSRPEIIRLEGSAFTGSGATFAPPPGNDYCLDVTANNGSSLARRCFEPGFIDLETGRPEASPYFFTLPHLDSGDISQVTLSKNRVALVVVTPSNTPPDLTVTYPNGGEILSGQQTITWEAHDADGDALQFDVLYSADRGQSWLPLAVRLTEPYVTFNTGQLKPGSQALIRVIASDGFHTTTDQSNAPFTIEPAAANSLSLRGPATVQAGQTFEVALVAHQLAEPGLFGIQFRLNFDPALLQVSNLTLHPSLDLAPIRMVDNQAGQVFVAASRSGRMPNLTGNLTLATFTFTATAPGQAYLHLTDVLAGARNGNPVPLPEIQGVYLYIAP